MIHINIGSNLDSNHGTRFENINLAINLLIDSKVEIIRISNFYETPSYPNQNFPRFLNVERLRPVREICQPATLVWPHATWTLVVGASNRPIEPLGRKNQERGKASWEQPFGKNLDKPILGACNVTNVANPRTFMRSELRTA